jgi:hypothetical protein
MMNDGMGLMDDIPLFYFNFDQLFEILKDACYKGRISLW